ncbi:flagellar biosynthetic protein FliO [Anaeromyxobacter oryzae]|uniref:Flagellar biosynthesis protein FliO n=1 Tax=Anaeromyxobacter oryzae TaxID=2918170 RepID=A0ABM7WY12_9BACT|nr:flagellar biosynthetic protein FliO [Anaeromyxobacter oryzae]BDG04362.1 hypothetical protein AMOR_33580 [Anaeromyxobacter oryzae]
MIAALAARLARLPAGRGALVVAGAAAGCLLVSAPGSLASAAARAALVVAALGAAAALSRRRPRLALAPELAVVARAALGKETGVALVDVQGRRLVVGFGPDGVSVLDAPAPPVRAEDRP